MTALAQLVAHVAQLVGFTARLTAAAADGIAREALAVTVVAPDVVPAWMEEE